CMGGRVSYLMAATNPAIRAAAAFYGGGIHRGEDGPAPIDLTANIRCPIIIFDGEQDEHPSPEEVRSTGAELARHGIVHEVHIYPGVGHGFMSAQGTRRRSEAIDDAWSRLLAWFQPPLVSEPASLATRPFQQPGTALHVSRRLFNALPALIDDRAVPRPDLLEAFPELNTDSWRLFPDGRMETTYRLKPSLTWHDGQPLTADD